MSTDRVTARVVGVLFILASAAAIVGGSLVLPLDDADSLRELVGAQHRVITGALIELVLVVTVVGIAALLYPVLRRHDEGLAMAYVAARTLEAVALLAASTTAVVAVALSGRTQGTGSGPVDALVMATRERTTLVGTLVLFAAGALVLYSILLRAHLVPVWLSLWGLIGAALLLVRGVVELYGTDLGGPLQGVFAAPIAVNEMVLAVWLIVKGFTSSDAVKGHELVSGMEPDTSTTAA